MVENVSARHGIDGRSLRLQTFLTCPTGWLPVVQSVWRLNIISTVFRVSGVDAKFTQFVNDLTIEPVYESQANLVSVAAYMSEKEFCVSVNEDVTLIERGLAAKIVVARYERSFSSE